MAGTEKEKWEKTLFFFQNLILYSTLIGPKLQR
jgi:hypothetical protein